MEEVPPARRRRTRSAGATAPTSAACRTSPTSPTKGAIAYPFKSYDGKVTFDRQKTGERTFDYTKEGVAHYGLYADWFEDLRRVGGEQLADDMWAGAEAYLQMWERASGVRAARLLRPPATRDRRARGRGPIRLGDDWQTLLRRAGQPQQRDRAWSWCVQGRAQPHAPPTSPCSAAGGRVELVGSTARGRNALGVGDRPPRDAPSARARRDRRRRARPPLGQPRVRLRRRARAASAPSA